MVLRNLIRENINTELSLLTIDIKDYEKKLFVLTNKANNEKEVSNQLSLVENLSAIDFKEFKSENSLAKLIRRISLFSLANFVSGLVSKENKQEFLRLSSEISSSEKLAEVYLKNNESYLSNCCQPCQRDFWEIKIMGSQEALYRFFSCSNPKCINSGLDLDLSKLHGNNNHC